jgi:hypothetical protein
MQYCIKPQNIQPLPGVGVVLRRLHLRLMILKPFGLMFLLGEFLIMNGYNAVNMNGSILARILSRSKAAAKPEGL